MAFGKKAHPPETPPVESTPEPAEVLSASERLNALLAEQAELEAAIATHREERARLMRESESPSLGAITALAAQTDQAKLRLEWIVHQLPGLQAQIAAEQAAQWEVTWQSHRPGLADAQTRLADAIREFHAALQGAHEVHNAARGFGNRVTDEFVRPPPVLYNDWSLREYVKTIEHRQQGGVAVPAGMMDLAIEAPLSVPSFRPRFTPRKVSMDEVEAISPLAEPRRVKILHGPVRASNLNFGIERMFEGEEHIVPARAAHALVASGIATYVAEQETAPAA
jgi:hypothetical protein